MDYRIIDVLANFISTLITKFRMLAGRNVHRRQGPQHREQRVAEQESLPCHYRVNSALLVKPAYLDPTSGSTTTWSTRPMDGSYINMLYVPKQQSHKRELITNSI
eukprot:279129-Amphidinium_carterae.1